MSPRFSVCVPFYNAEAFIGETIRSVLDQTYRDYEVVLSDNASTDASLRIARSFASDLVRVVGNPQNLGLSANFDRVTEAATGRHLLILSADDLMLPGALETYARVLDGLGAAAGRSVLTSAYDVIDGRGRRTGIMYRPAGQWFYELTASEHEVEDRHAVVPEAAPGLAVLAEALRRRQSPAAFVATCYPRSMLAGVGGYRSGFRAWPDTHFLLKLLSEGPDLVYVPERLFAYRKHGGNESTAADRIGTYQMDSYLHVVEFPQPVLDAVGVGRDELVAAYLRRAIFGRAARSVGRGEYVHAFRCLAFGMATCPGRMARDPSAYLVALTLLLGPLGRRLVPAVARWRGLPA